MLSIADIWFFNSSIKFVSLCISATWSVGGVVFIAFIVCNEVPDVVVVVTAPSPLFGVGVTMTGITAAA